MVDSNFKVYFLVAADSVGIEEVLGGISKLIETDSCYGSYFLLLLAKSLENQFSDFYLNLFRYRSWF